MNIKILALLSAAACVASPALAVINAPVPADNYITFGGADWAWASPCSPYVGNSCGPIDMTYQSTQGWRIAEAADFLSGITAADFGPADNFKCASDYFATYVPSHCDYGDGAAHYVYNDPLNPFPDESRLETWVIRDASPAPEPASWALMLGGFGLVGGAMRARRKAAVTFA